MQFKKCVVLLLVLNNTCHAFTGQLSSISALVHRTVRQQSAPRCEHVYIRNAAYINQACFSRGLASTNNDGEISSTTIAGVEVPNSTAKPLSLLLVAQFILFIGVGAVIPTIPLYGKAIGLSSAMNGLVISAPALALLILAKPSGEYADKARKPAMMWGMALIALSDLGTALAQSLIPLVVARIGLGAGRCVSESGERGILADLASTIPELRGRALASQQAVLALGIAVGAPAGGYVVEMYGPRASFLCVTAAASLALILYNFLPETVENASIVNDDGTVVERSDMTVDWGELLKDSQWQGLSLFEVGAKFGYACKLASIPLIAAQVLPGGAIGAGALVSAAGLSGFLGAPLGGIFVDKFGSRNTLVGTGVISAAGLMAIPFALGAQDFGAVPSWALFSTSVLTWSIAVSAQNPSTTAFAQEISPAGSEATAMALPRAAGDSVYLFAPFLLGSIADMAGLPIGSECFFAGFCALMGTAALAVL